MSAGARRVVGIISSGGGGTQTTFHTAFLLPSSATLHFNCRCFKFYFYMQLETFTCTCGIGSSVCGSLSLTSPGRRGVQYNMGVV